MNYKNCVPFCLRPVSSVVESEYRPASDTILYSRSVTSL
jgi:hypothetical protein